MTIETSEPQTKPRARPKRRAKATQREQAALKWQAGEVLTEGAAGSLIGVPTRIVNWPETDDNGQPIARSQTNIGAFLEGSGIRLGYNRFTYTPTIWHADRWHPIDNSVVVRISMAMHRKYFNPLKDFLYDALSDIAYARSFHPVLDYFSGLKWDGINRLDKWLSTYLGADDNALNNAFGRCQLMAAVARVKSPGCKKDEMLVLIGPQGIGKSTALRILASDVWFTDAVKAGMNSKQVIELSEGRLFLEVSELDGLNHKAASAVKAMLSTQRDSSRMSYGRMTTNRQRQFVFFGSTNDSTFLIDDTGNRRFWPVQCKPMAGSKMVDLQGLKRDRDQLWAEAVHRFDQGESYELPERTMGRGCKGSGGPHSNVSLDGKAGVGSERQTRNYGGRPGLCVARD